jgi:hypothetical protein
VTLDGALACGGEGNISSVAVVTGGGGGEYVAVAQAGRALVCALRWNGSYGCFSTVDLTPIPQYGIATLVYLQLVCDGGAGTRVADADASCCGLLQNGTVACWRVATAASRGAVAPVWWQPGPFSFISTGGGLTCGLLLDENMPQCWFSAGGGAARVPAAAHVPLGSLSVGNASFVCGVTLANASVVCWQSTAGGAVSYPALPQMGSTAVQVAVSASGIVCVINFNTGVIVSRSLTATPAPRLQCPFVGVSVLFPPPGLCVFATATARDAGGAPGIGVGDTLTVQYSADVNTRCATLSATPAGVDLQLRLSSPLGANYSAVWATPARVVVTITNAAGASVDATRVGALTVAFARSDCVDNNATGVQMILGAPLAVGGSWGAWPAPALLSATAKDSGGGPGLGPGDAIVLRFDSDTNRPPLDDGVLSSPLGAAGTTNWTWLDSRTAVGARGDMHPADPSGTRLGALRVALDGAHGVVRSRDWSSPPCTDAVVVGGGWGNAIASVRVGASGGTVLATAGGERVVLVLAAPLGRGSGVASAVAVTYSNYARSYTALDCVIAPADGASVECAMAAPGVGAGLRWTLHGAGLDNVTSAPAASSYAAPVLSALAPAEVATDCACVIQFSGTDFGAASGDLAPVEFRPIAVGAGGGNEVFYTTNCSVVVPQSAIACTAPPLRGAAVTATLTVGGQRSSSAAALTTAPPGINNVTLSIWDAACGSSATLCTAGGDTVRISGTNFGGRSDGVVVTYSGLVAAECVIMSPHTVMECVTVRGAGALPLLWSVSVLGVTSAAYGALIYAPPRLLALTGSYATSGFYGVLACVNCAAAPATAVFGDGRRAAATLLGGGGAPTLLSVAVPACTGAANATVALEMAGAVSAPHAFTYAAPLVSAVDVLEVNASGAYTLSILGANFVSGATVVTVGGAPCALTAAAAAAAEVVGGSVACTTRAPAGAIVVTVSEQSSPPYMYDVAAPQSTPIVSALEVVSTAGGRGGGEPLPLALGGWVVINGASLRAALPGVTRVVRAPYDDCGTAQPACLNTTVSLLSIYCLLPPSRISRLALAVIKLAGPVCTASAPVTFAYAPPRVAAVSPRVIDPTGGDLLYVTGDNFEGRSTISVGGAACVVVASNASCIVCAAPPGVGALQVVAVASPTAGAVYVPADCGVRRKPPLVSGFAPSIVPARGGVLVTLTGRHFGAAPLVLLDGAPLLTIAVVAPGSGDGANTCNVTVLVPMGAGAAHVLTLEAGDQSAAAPGALSYAPPSLSAASVPFMDAADGGTITLTGANFGPPGTPVAVTIGGVSCSRAVVLNDGAASAVLAAFQTVDGAATATLTVGGQTAVLPSPLPLLCPPGMFGGDGERCRACPAHAVCYGGRFEPLPSGGYYRAARTAFLACAPPEACAPLPPPAPEQLLSVSPDSNWALVAPSAGAGGGGGNASAGVLNCAAPAYTGPACSICGAGYYRVATPCIPCPSHAAAVFGIYAGVVLLMIGVLQWAYRRRAMLKGLTVGIDFLQVMTMFAGFEFQWPPLVRIVFSFASVFSFNIAEQAAPECTIAVTFFEKWLALQLFPAAVIALIVLSYGGAMLTAVVQAALCATRRAGEGTAPLVAAAATERAARLRSKVGRQYDLAVGSCLTVLCASPLLRSH